MIIRRDIKQGTDEWKRARLGLATASIFDAVMSTLKSGEEPAVRRQKRVQKALELITGKPVGETYTNQAMREGIEREPFARAAYEALTGELVEEVGIVLHDYIPAGASPDGLVGRDGLLEIKSPTHATHLEYLLRKNEPPEYRAQIQGQLWICERKWCDFVSYHPDFPQNAELVVRRVFRDEAYIATLALSVEKFCDEVAATVAQIRGYCMDELKEAA